MKQQLPAYIFAWTASALLVSWSFAHEATLLDHLAKSRQTVDQRETESDTNSGPDCKLSIKLIDEGTGQPQHGLVRVTDLSSGKYLRLTRWLERPMGWYATPPEVDLTLPCTRIKIEACHGIETELYETTLDLADRTNAQIVMPLHRFYDPASRGLCSGNTHLHLILDEHRKLGVQLESRQEADEYLRMVSKSDGLDIVYVSYLTRPGKSYITNDYTAEDFARLSDSKILFAAGEEYRHDGRNDADAGRLTYGHVMFLGIRQLVKPASIGPGLTPEGAATDGVPLRHAMRQIRDDGATVIWCHGTMGTEDVPDWLDGLVHAQNIYDGGNVGTIETVFYPYLNAGLKVPFSSGTDWGVWDFSRVYVPSADDVTSGSFLQSLTQGRSFITNGTFLELEVNGQHPGDSIALAEQGLVEVRARAIGRADFEKLQLIFNGQVVREMACRSQTGHFAAELNDTVEITEPGWIALRIPTRRSYDIRSQYEGRSTNILGKTLFAHTSPVYITVAGADVRRPDAVRQLLADIQTSVAEIRTRGSFQTAAERRTILKIYEDAALSLHKRLREDTTVDRLKP